MVSPDLEDSPRHGRWGKPWGIDESVEVTMAGYTDFEAGKADTGGDNLGEK